VSFSLIVSLRSGPWSFALSVGADPAWGAPVAGPPARRAGRLLGCVAVPGRGSKRVTQLVEVRIMVPKQLK